MLRNRERRRLKRIAFEPGDVAIDVGANDGGTTQLLLDKGAIVYAFEPQPVVYQQLKERFAGNSQVVCYEAAAWIHDGTIPLYCHATKTEAASVYEGKRNVDTALRLDVMSIDLAQFIRNQAPVKLLYINAEGAEYELILHLCESGAIEHVDHVIASPHSHKIRGIEDVVAEARAAAKYHNISL